MAKNQNSLAESAQADEDSGRSVGFLAEENGLDRRTLWRLGSWGAGSVGAVIVAFLAYNSSLGLRSQQIIAADPVKQSPLMEITKAAEKEIRRLSSAIDTLNGDRDRLFARVAVIEQGFESLTGSIGQRAAQADAGMTTASTSSAIELDPPGRPELGPSTTANASPDTPPSAPVALTKATAAAVKPLVASPSPADALSRSANTQPTPSPTTNSSSVQITSGTESHAATATSVTPKTALKLGTAAHDPLTTVPRGRGETAPLGAAKTEPERNIHGHKEAQIAVASIPPIEDAVQPPSPAIASSREVDAVPREENASNQKDGVSHRFREVEKDSSPVPAPRTDFGVDLGSASSINGLRALWQNLLKLEAKELTSLYPIIVLKETNNGSGMQMRLVAGPLADAAGAARICAVLSGNGRTCGTAVFDGQRLPSNKDGNIASTTKKPRPAQVSRQRPSRKSTRVVAEPAQPPPPPPKPATLGSFFSR